MTIATSKRQKTGANSMSGAPEAALSASNAGAEHSPQLAAEGARCRHAGFVQRSIYRGGYGVFQVPGSCTRGVHLFDFPANQTDSARD